MKVEKDKKKIAEEERDCMALAQLYLSGLSFRKIAKLFSNDSHVTIRKKILSIEDSDEELYFDVLNKIEENTPDSIKKPHVRTRVEEVTEIFLKGDKTIVEIAKEMGTTEFITYRDLTIRLPQLKEYSEEPKFSETIINDVQEKLENHRLSNLTQNQQKQENKQTR